MNTTEEFDMYEHEIGRFQELMAENPDYAYQRYGLTLFYSLPPEETFNLKASLGWKGKDALDQYNHGVIEANKGNLKEAMKLFESALADGCERPEVFFNIAVIHEEEGQKGEAKEFYQKYIDAVEELDSIPRTFQDDLDETREHITTL